MFDIIVWRRHVLNEIENIADEKSQREDWFGKSELIDSPDEQFCRFFDDASISDFLAWKDNNLDASQTSNLNRLHEMMRKLSDGMPDFIKPEDLIDDPRWQAIRDQARTTLETFNKSDRADET